MRRLIRLESGRWYARVEEDTGGREHLYLSSAERPSDSMRRSLPFSWRDLDDEALVELARDPELRLWTDEHGLQWRIAAVGPGTPHEFSLPHRYLVFDSVETWVGITRFSEGKLGDLAADQLRELRDDIADLGGSRKGFRPPDQTERRAPVR